MKILLTYCILFFGHINLMSQTKNDFKILKEITSDFEVMDCKNISGKPRCKMEPVSKNDSINFCSYVRTFTTNEKHTLFQMEYNFYDNIIAKGRIRNFKNGKFKKTYFKVFTWKEYDYSNDKIRLLEYIVAHSEKTYYSVIAKIEEIKI